MTDTEPVPLPIPEPVVEIPKDLQASLSSLKAIKQTHNLLQSGSFPFGFNDAIVSSLAFLESLHKQLVDEAIKHPQADLVPELKTLKEKQNV